MFQSNTKRWVLGSLLVGLSVAVSTVTLAHGRAGCEGKSPEERAKHAAERFQRADKNNDGFLTRDEVGDKRWERIKVADSNGDGKVTEAEIDKARSEGKLGPRGKKSA
jgi:hypothetical protein